MNKETRLLKVDAFNPEKEKITLAAQILQQGGLVAFPTETVYGLGADGLNGQAVKEIFQAKGRPSDNPLILHVASLEEVEKLVSFLPKEAEVLAAKFWPGPLTLVLPKRGNIPREVTAGLDTVAIRVPSHPVALELIRQSGLAIAAPSANLSGKPSPTTAQHVQKDLWGKVDIILDGGNTGVGLESTVIDLTGGYPMLLRPGGITLEELEKELGRVELDPWLQQRGIGEEITPRSPGMKYTHYSPEAEVILVIGEDQEQVKEKMEQLAREEAKRGRKVGLMVTGEYHRPLAASVVKNMSCGGSLEEVAANLYRLLREMDQLQVDLVLVEGVSYQGLGLAIMNRLEKAAGYQLVKV